MGRIGAGGRRIEVAGGRAGVGEVRMEVEGGRIEVEGKIEVAVGDGMIGMEGGREVEGNVDEVVGDGRIGVEGGSIGVEGLESEVRASESSSAVSGRTGVTVSDSLSTFSSGPMEPPMIPCCMGEMSETGKDSLSAVWFFSLARPNGSSNGDCTSFIKSIP